MSCDSYDEYGHPHNDGDPGCCCADCAHDTLQRARFLEAENSRLKEQLTRANDDANKYCREANRFNDQVLSLTQVRDEALRLLKLATPILQEFARQNPIHYVPDARSPYFPRPHDPYGVHELLRSFACPKSTSVAEVKEPQECS